MKLLLEQIQLVCLFQSHPPPRGFITPFNDGLGHLDMFSLPLLSYPSGRSFHQLARLDDRVVDRNTRRLGRSSFSLQSRRGTINCNLVVATVALMDAFSLALAIQGAWP